MDLRTLRRIEGDLRAEGVGKDGVADGMKVDVEGNLYTTGPEGVWVFAPDGRLLGKILPPEIPANLTFGGWLAGARNWHFAMMWVLAVNGLVYLGFIYLHGEWRDLVPRRGIVRDAWQMIRFYLSARNDHPRQGKHNALQRLAYFSMPLVGIMAIVTGLAIWKPVELAPLAGLLGGYAWARYWHFWAMLLLVLLTFGHIFMVFTVDPYSIPSMITGRYREDLSPEARNARPFVHLLPSDTRPAATVPSAENTIPSLPEPPRDRDPAPRP